VTSVPADATAARRAAAAILREGRFHAPSVPRPLHGVLHAIGEGISSMGNAIAHVVDRIGRVVPGGPAAVWIVLGLALGAAIALAARRQARRALWRDRGEIGRSGARGPERAAELERAAAEAERDGRYGEAVRLRFRAGLAGLAEQGAITRPASTPTVELARALHSEEFDALARRFDEIAYGAAPAAAEDAQEARRRWDSVVSARATTSKPAGVTGSERP
jgi:Domain of unknown function (DUF4129)